MKGKKSVSLGAGIDEVAPLCHKERASATPNFKLPWMKFNREKVRRGIIIGDMERKFTMRAASHKETRGTES